MIPVSPHPVRWSRQRWIAAIALILILQTALVFLLSEKPAPAATATESSPTIAMVLDPGARQQIIDLLAASDPTLFALASPRGFSGQGWLIPPARQHRLQEWTEPDLELAHRPPNTGLMLATYLRTNLAPVESLTTKYTPELRSLVRPVLLAPLLTTNLSPPEPARPAGILPRPVPAWSTLEAQAPNTSLPPRFVNPAETWLSFAPTNAAGHQPLSPIPARPRPTAPLPVPSTVRPRA